MSKAPVLAVSAFLAMSFAAASAQTTPKVAKVTVNQPVTLTDNGDSWTMDNGIVKMTILKRNGTIAIGSLIVSRDQHRTQPRRVLGDHAGRHRHHRRDD